MGRGLSPMQEEILRILPGVGVEEWEKSSIEPEGGRYRQVLMKPKEIIEALGLPNTNASRAAVSKSLDRLMRRGLVVAWSSQVATQGRGYRYTRAPEGET